VFVDAPGVSSTVTAVGYDGLVYLEDPAPESALRVQIGDGLCRTPLPSMDRTVGMVDLGVLVCR